MTLADVDPRDRFDAAASSYAAWRPGYPDAIVEAVLGDPRPRRALDVGCGTGIFTRQLHARGVEVLGIDPSEGMLGHARAAGGPGYARGEAGRTGLADRSVDLVVAAHAFHWFDADAALGEWARILAPGGRVAVVFNLKARTPLLASYEALLEGASERAAAQPSPRAALAALLRRPELLHVERLHASHGQVLDREGFLGRARSSSCVVHEVDDRGRFERALHELFDRHAIDGRVRFDYDCAGLRFGLREPLSRTR